jgi:hypothetical protein
LLRIFLPFPSHLSEEDPSLAFISRTSFREECNAYEKGKEFQKDADFEEKKTNLAVLSSWELESFFVSITGSAQSVFLDMINLFTTAALPVTEMI